MTFGHYFMPHGLDTVRPLLLWMHNVGAVLFCARAEVRAVTISVTEALFFVSVFSSISLRVRRDEDAPEKVMVAIGKCGGRITL